MVILQLIAFGIKHGPLDYNYCRIGEINLVKFYQQ